MKLHKPYSTFGKLCNPDFTTEQLRQFLKKHKLIKEWLEYSDMATTANIYSHVDSASKKVTGDVIGGVLGANSWYEWHIYLPN